VTLRVQLTLAPNELSKAIARVAVHFGEEDVVALRVFVSAEQFLVEPRWQTMQVRRAANSEQLTFTLIGQEAGSQMIEVELFHQTERVGYAVVETKVVEG
jgi:hypothetical protein